MNRHLPAFLLFLQIGWAGALPLPETLLSAFQRELHCVQHDGGVYRANNPENRLNTEFTPEGITALHPGGTLRLHLAAYGYGNRLTTPGPARMRSHGNRVEYQRGPITEWYANQTRGMEQGFTIQNRPANGTGGPLTLELALGGDLSPVLAGNDVHFERDGREVLRYAGLRAWDALGRTLSAHMELRGNRIRLLVADRHATYPVTIDPWIQQQKLTATGTYPVSVSVSGDTAVIGAPGTVGTASQSPGSAYVYVRSAGIWTLQQTLMASDAVISDQFGAAVALNGDMLVIGAPGDNFTQRSKGKVSVFVRAGTVWTQLDEFSADSVRAPTLAFGYSVSISGDGQTLVVGAPYTGPVLGTFSVGAAFVYARNGNGWNYQTELSNYIYPPFEYDALGSSVSVDRNTAAIAGQSSTYVLVRNGGSWSLQAKLTPGPQGGVVAINGDTLLVGSPYGNSVLVFVRNGANWTQQQTLPPNGAEAGFGASLAIRGNKAVIGSYANQAGSANVFVRNGTVWGPRQQIPSSDNALGKSVSLDAATLLVGGNGAAYVFVHQPGVRDLRDIGRSDALLYDPHNGQEYTALSNGDGTYSYIPNLYTSAFDTLRTGDFNGDGQADLVVYNSLTANAYLGLSNGDGTFAFRSLFWSPGYDFVEAGDLNGDGETDFALYNSSTGTMHTGISNGSGDFTYKYTLISKNYTSVRLADFNGDGKADILLYNAANGIVFLGIGDGGGGFTFHAMSTSGGYDLIDVGDLNGDGHADLVLYNSANGNAATGMSDGDGGMTFTPLLWSPGFTSVRLADYTGDGKADVTLYNKNTAAAYFGTGTGTGSFTFQSLFWSPGYDRVEPQDVNGDGKVDIILYNSTTGTEYTAVSNGNGTFTYTYSLWGPGKILAK